ncbi:hypothetical protein H0H81_006673 [Sphagnurus paluster]|uniref:Aminoglycoside phosphotransferase domain-containing protein n=1 Tax=Sphagnurus paluster TaxID=117069 RepID=A0A9P7KLW7_9AGAR|nr:hypothetical protein H0H81_006673 [Sphagnurus paluster]
MTHEPFSVDWLGVEDPWVGISVDLVTLQSIVCQVLHIPTTQSGPPVAIGLDQQANYARIYSFRLPSRTVIARLVAPVKPLFKTESEVAAMDFVRSHTPLPVPKVFAYCSEASNPVGTEWLLMEHMPGVELGGAWDDLQLPQKRRLALDLIGVYDQLFRLKIAAMEAVVFCIFTPIEEPLLTVPSPSQMLPTFTTDDYVKLVAFNGNPSTRSDYDFPTCEKCVELFQSIHNLYLNSTVFGPAADASNFRFSHGDLHDGNILIDLQSGAITGIIDWEAAAFHSSWVEVCGVGWFEEDRQQFIIGSDEPRNFDDDTAPEDTFRTELHRRNPDLFSCFLGAVELCAVLHAAVDDPRPLGETDIFLNRYYRLGYWKADRRGAFPWDMEAWQHRHMDLDELNMKRIDSLKRAQANTCAA